jgi:hypothetical protein
VRRLAATATDLLKSIFSAVIETTLVQRCINERKKQKECTAIRFDDWKYRLRAGSLYKSLGNCYLAILIGWPKFRRFGRERGMCIKNEYELFV